MQMMSSFAGAATGARTTRRPAAWRPVRWRPVAWRAVTSCLCLAALTGAGCERTLCPARFYPADISVRLAADWPADADMRVTISCPAEAECGFLNGPVTGRTDSLLTISTVLRPERVDVRVTEASSGRLVAENQLEVDYQPVGRQSRCGGNARAEVLMPYA